MISHQKPTSVPGYLLLVCIQPQTVPRPKSFVSTVSSLTRLLVHQHVHFHDDAVGKRGFTFKKINTLDLYKQPNANSIFVDWWLYSAPRCCQQPDINDIWKKHVSIVFHIRHATIQFLGPLSNLVHHQLRVQHVLTGKQTCQGFQLPPYGCFHHPCLALQ
ncbi:hypothetical protein M378DRAFT_300974 [Amanita muscaria Koide BX008]|uniref:Uncharacterized protein n=1 Tax=Amanita muscaria (strain Koide BX008) TaxID=946122 RepID=A0A0C2XCZ6_AMAMK|nr:hypothetical protein M378DRAFT_300974 [Amanita muscaria Koide BX008]